MRSATFLAIVVFPGWFAPPPAPAAPDAAELVRNPEFTTAEGAALPEHWTAIEPDWPWRACRFASNSSSR